MESARAARGLRARAAGRGRRGAVPHDVRGAAPLSPPAARARVHPARRDRGALRVHRRPPGLADPRCVRCGRRLPRADPRLDGRGKPRDAVLVLPGAEPRHPRDRALQGVARIERDGLPLHVLHRARVGAALLSSGLFRLHGAVPRRVLRALRRGGDPLRAARGAPAQALRRRDARLRNAARRVRAAGGAHQGDGIRPRVVVRRGLGVLSRAGGAAPAWAREPRDAHRGVLRAGRGVRHPRDPARPRRALDLGRVGGGGRGDRVVRDPPATAPRPRLRHSCSRSPPRSSTSTG